MRLGLLGASSAASLNPNTITIEFTECQPHFVGLGGAIDADQGNHRWREHGSDSGLDPLLQELLEINALEQRIGLDRHTPG